MHREKEELSRFLERDDESAKIRIENDIRGKQLHGTYVHMYVVVAHLTVGSISKKT